MKFFKSTVRPATHAPQPSKILELAVQRKLHPLPAPTGNNFYDNYTRASRLNLAKQTIERNRSFVVDSSFRVAKWYPEVQKVRKTFGKLLGTMIAKARKAKTWDETGAIALEMWHLLRQAGSYYQEIKVHEVETRALWQVNRDYFNPMGCTLLDASYTMFSAYWFQLYLAPSEKDTTNAQDRLHILLTAIVTDLSKIMSGEWEVPNYTNWDWIHHYDPDAVLHVPHLSQNNKMQIAYTQTWEKKARDIQTAVRPGRYYATFLDQDDANHKAQQHNGAYGEAKLFFRESDDPDGWMHVYAHGPNSCMSSEPWKIEPYALAGNGLRLAYISRNNHPDSTSISARAIVRDDDNRGYVRIYGDEERIRPLLESAGYGRHINLHGIKIAKIDHPDRSGYVFPYIDSGNGGSQRVDIFSDHLLIRENGDISCCNTDGTGEGCNGEDDDTWTCEVCEDRYETYSEEPVYISNHGHVCSYCRDNNFSYIENRFGHNRWYHNDDVTPVVESRWANTDVPTEDIAHRSDIVKLDWSYDYCDYALVDVAVDTPEGWMCIHDDDCRGLERAHDGCRYAHTSYTKEIDGKIYHEDDDISDLIESEEETTEQATEE